MARPSSRAKRRSPRAWDSSTTRTTASSGLRSAPISPPPAILATPTATTSSTRKIKMASRSSNTASTPASGSSKKTEAGRSSSTWATPAPNRSSRFSWRPSRRFSADFAVQVFAAKKSLFPKVVADRLRLRSGHDRRQRRRVGLLHRLHAANMFQQSPCCARANAGHFQQFGGPIPHLPALAVEGQGKTVGLIANELNQVKHRRVMVQRNRVFLLAVDVQDLLAFGDGSQRLIDDLERLQRVRSRVQLSETTVDQHEAGHGFVLIPQTLVTPRDHLAHRSEIVHAFHGANDELAVIRLLHLSVFPYHHRGDGLSALNVVWEDGKMKKSDYRK